jgi:hypothetical protein
VFSLMSSSATPPTYMVFVPSDTNLAARLCTDAEVTTVEGTQKTVNLADLVAKAKLPKNRFDFFRKSRRFKWTYGGMTYNVCVGQLAAYAFARSISLAAFVALVTRKEKSS